MRLVTIARAIGVLAGIVVMTRAHAQWLDELPLDVASALLWRGDVEEGALSDWTYPSFQYPGGGVFNTGVPPEAVSVASSDVAHSGVYSARASISGVYRAQNGSRAVRLFRWTDRPWDDGGGYFPAVAYYSTWVYFPRTYNPNKYPPWDPGDGGWWNIFQFKSDDASGVSQPIFTLNVDHDDATGSMRLYLYTNYNEPHSWAAAVPLALPVGRWVHIEALYSQSADDSGRVAFWQDGRLLLLVPRARTILAQPATWSINNYTDHIVGGPVDGAATVYFDDAAVGVRRISGTFAPPVAAIPDGFRAAGHAMYASRAAGSAVDLRWDASSCPPPQRHVLYGSSSELARYGYSNAVCALDDTGHATIGLPDPAAGQFVWWILVGGDGPTESHHGFDSTGLPRPAQAGGLCGLVQQGETNGCPR